MAPQTQGYCGTCCSSRLKIDVSSNDSVKKRIKDYCESSYMHGPAGIARSQNIVRLLIWIIMFLGSWGMTIWMLRNVIAKYYTYPTSTALTLNSNATMQFPAVTICNVNPVRHSKLDDSSAAINNLIKSKEGTVSASVVNWNARKDNSSFYEFDDDTRTELDFEHQYVSLTEDTKKEIGHQLDTMLISCRFRGRGCSPSNFTNFVNYKYGNCYTFNSGLGGSILNTQKTGPLYGLSMELYLEHWEYIGNLANDAGIRLVVHNQSSIPFPEDEGVSVSPGERTSVAISMLSILRAKPKYGDCKSFTDDENQKYNAWAQESALKIGYSMTACQKTCLQQSLITNCGCCSSNYPCSGSAIDPYISAYGKTVGYCLYSDSTQEDCANLIISKHEAGTLNCDHCKSPCDETEYKTKISSSYWPSNAYLDDAVNDFASSSSELYSNLTSVTSTAQKREFMATTDIIARITTVTLQNIQLLRLPTIIPSMYRSNIQNGVKVDIYYRHLNFERMETTSSYGISDLLSDIGGQLGLWVGLSVVSTFEVFELLGDIVTIMILRYRKRGQVATDEDNFEGKQNINNNKSEDNTTYVDPNNEIPLSLKSKQ